MAYEKATKVVFLIDGKIQYVFDRCDPAVAMMDDEYEQLSETYPNIKYERHDEK